MSLSSGLKRVMLVTIVLPVFSLPVVRAADSTLVPIMGPLQFIHCKYMMTSWAPVDSVYDVVPREFERAYRNTSSAALPNVVVVTSSCNFIFRSGLNELFPNDEKQASSRNSSCNSVKALNAVCGRRIFLIHHRFISASFLPTSLWRYYIRVVDTSFSFAHLEMKSLHWLGVEEIFFSSSLVKSSTSCRNMRSRLSPSIFTRVTYSRNYLHNFAKLIPLLNLSSRRSLKIISDFNPDLGIVLVFTASVSVTLVFPGRSAFLTPVSRSSMRNVQVVMNLQSPSVSWRLEKTCRTRRWHLPLLIQLLHFSSSPDLPSVSHELWSPIRVSFRSWHYQQMPDGLQDLWLQFETNSESA